MNTVLKYCFLLAVVLFAAHPAPAAIAHVQSKAASAASITYTNAVSAGDLLVVAVNFAGNACSTPTSTGETWVQIRGCIAWNASADNMSMYYVQNCGSHAASYSVAATNAFAMHIYEFSGVATTGALDVSNSAANATSTAGSNNMTPGTLSTNGADLVIGWATAFNGPTVAGNNVAWNDPLGDVHGTSEYFIQSSSGSIAVDETTNFGSGDPYGAIGAAFKPAGGAASCASSIALMGVGCR